ncbi:MAG: cytochrome c nitrite reductase small subunit [Aeoliella sp.]
MSAKQKIGWTTALAVLSAALIGAAVGLGTYTFTYAEGASYMTNNPQACANCHVMQGHLDAWVKSSHGKFATCNDCHAPHDTAGKYYCKARNGFFHSLAFTTDDFPDNIRITDYNRQVTESACRDCHQDVTHQVDMGVAADGTTESLSCIKCHATVGHDR